MKNLIHNIYLACGHCAAAFCLAFWKIRDAVNPPKEKAVLFVAHPDDDTLFFHSFIKENKPYVCLMTTGWSMRRMPCFFRAMKKYGVRYRAYDMKTRDTRTHLLEKHVREVMQAGSFEICATHGESGEYGHEMHKRVHNAVMSAVSCRVFVPVPVNKITDYPLPQEIIDEKEEIFKRIYTTETWVLEQYREWVDNEKLIEE